MVYFILIQEFVMRAKEIKIGDRFEYRPYMGVPILIEALSEVKTIERKCTAPELYGQKYTRQTFRCAVVIEQCVILSGDEFTFDAVLENVVRHVPRALG